MQREWRKGQTQQRSSLSTVTTLKQGFRGLGFKAPERNKRLDLPPYPRSVVDNKNNTLQHGLGFRQ